MFGLHFQKSSLIIIFLIFEFLKLSGNPILNLSEDYDTVQIKEFTDKARNEKFRNSEIALELAKTSLDISEKSGFTKGIIENKVLLAEIYLISADYENALKYYISALEMFEGSENLAGTAAVSNEVGKIYSLTGNFDKALFYYEKSLYLNKKLNQVNEIASNYSNIGRLYILKDNVDTGLSHLLVAYMIADSLGNNSEMIELLNNIGNGYLKIKKYREALGTFSRELQLSQKEKNNFTIARAYYNLGNTLFLSNDYVASLKNINHSLELAKSGNFNKILQDAEFILSMLYEEAGNFEAAYLHHKEYKNYSDSILNEAMLKQIADIQAKYDLNAKEKENQLLRLQNQEIQKTFRQKNKAIIISLILIGVFMTNLFLLLRANKKYRILNRKLSEQSEQLKELNQQKDRFFSFVVHNLNNPFNTVWGFSELLQKYAEQHDTEKMIRYSKYIYDSSGGIRQILSNLLEWTSLQKGNYEYNPSKIELESLIKDTLELNSRVAAVKDISLSCDQVVNKYAYADRQMVYTILQNIISNAIQFTPANGKINVSAKYIGRYIEISVTDSGIGLTEKDIKRLFKIDVSTAGIGVHGNKGAGMGLIICKELITKNGGDIFVESTPGKGSTFRFTLPLPEKEMEYLDYNDAGLESL
ncbi:MAG: sensor histidine kinase [Bacteroidales bacterium]|nr:sensor histidine kinase [Bacteroidales bacterium]